LLKVERLIHLKLFGIGRGMAEVLRSIILQLNVVRLVKFSGSLQ